jgi:hypothetical protein
MLNTNYANYNTIPFKNNFIVSRNTAKTIKGILKNVEGPYPLGNNKTGRVYFRCPDPKKVIDNQNILFKHNIPFLFKDDKGFEELMSAIKKEVGIMRRSEARLKKDLQKKHGKR